MIRDPEGKIAYYVAKYTTKADKGTRGSEVGNAVSKLKPDASLSSKLHSLVLGSLKSCEVGQEAAADVLNANAPFTLSETTKYFAVSTPDKRKHVMKGSKKQLEAMEKEGRGDECPVHLGFWNGLYPYRPEELEDRCALEVFENYDRVAEREYERIQKREEKKAREAAGRGEDPPPPAFELFASIPGTPDDRPFYLKLRREPYVTPPPLLPPVSIETVNLQIIITRTFRAETADQGEETAHCYLLLFCPFRDESELLGEHRTYLEAFDAVIEGPHSLRHVILLLHSQAHDRTGRGGSVSRSAAGHGGRAADALLRPDEVVGERAPLDHAANHAAQLAAVRAQHHE